MAKVNAGTTSPFSGMFDGIKQLVTEDGGQISTTRSWGYIVLGLLVDDLAINGNPLTWIHGLIIVGVLFAKALQKFAEKPAQGVINAKALEFLVTDAVKRITGKPPGGSDE